MQIRKKVGRSNKGILVPLTPIQLIIGLGNPGEKYTHTRHNAGAWWVERVANDLDIQLRPESKFHSRIASINVAGQTAFISQPTTFMNLSGQSVRAISQFYQIPPESILVIHDELDFPAGIVRLKKGGGHGGHNGLRDIMQHLQTGEFYRLRLGIGHPGDRSQVLDYVLGRPSAGDFSLICEAINQSVTVLPELMSGDMEKAMQTLHSAS
jgi:PTH1 family peptidyl-tRNA hydrolase